MCLARVESSTQTGHYERSSSSSSSSSYEPDLMMNERCPAGEREVQGSSRMTIYNCNWKSAIIILAFACIAFVHLPLASASDDITTSKGQQEEWIHNDILSQVDFALRANVKPMTVVTEIEGIRPISSDSTSTGTPRGLGVMYVGEEALPPGTTVGLYRALLVRKDLLYEWIDNGTIESAVWKYFWKYYSVEFVNNNDNALSSWMALPVGDVNKGPDDPTWWVQGHISKDKLDEAITAVNAKVLVDWRRLAAGNRGQFLMFNAHILNEPSAGGAIGLDGELLQEEEENIGHLVGSGCSSVESSKDRAPIQYCGAAFEAKTSKSVYPGDQLVWCYGQNYDRNYPVAKICLDDDIRENRGGPIRAS